MKILIVSATALEVKKITSKSIPCDIPLNVDLKLKHATDFLVTGIGAVPTAFCIAKHASRYDFILNIGIAGTYNTNIDIGQVVVVAEDAFGDYGIDDNGYFKTLGQAGLVGIQNSANGDLLQNPWLEKINFGNIRIVKGITLGTASGSVEIIGKIKRIWNPDIETMESAAVFYSCLKLNKLFLCVRAISNIVEPRNRDNWQIENALDSLNNEVLNIIRNLDVSI